MLKEVFEIDGDGYLRETYVKEFDGQGNCKENLAENIITTSIPQGLYLPKWTGAKWIEDMTQEEIDALNNQPKLPTEIEVLQQENESLVNAITEITMLISMIFEGGI